MSFLKLVSWFELMFPKFGIAKVAVIVKPNANFCKWFSDSFVYLYYDKMFVPFYELANSSVRKRLWRGCKFQFSYICPCPVLQSLPWTTQCPIHAIWVYKLRLSKTKASVFIFIAYYVPTAFDWHVMIQIATAMLHGWYSNHYCISGAGNYYSGPDSVNILLLLLLLLLP